MILEAKFYYYENIKNIFYEFCKLLQSKDINSYALAHKREPGWVSGYEEQWGLSATGELMDQEEILFSSSSFLSFGLIFSNIS